MKTIYRNCNIEIFLLFIVSILTNVPNLCGQSDQPLNYFKLKPELLNEKRNLTSFDESFTENFGSSLAQVGFGNIVCGDYDDDGYLDFLLMGKQNNNINVTKIYHGDGDGTFTEYSQIVLDGISAGSADWGDYDNDGDLDIVISGFKDVNFRITKIYRNDSSSLFTELSDTLIGLGHSSVAWGDYDNDGDKDVIVNGSTNLSTIETKIYRNDGNDTFIELLSHSLIGVAYGSSAWGDYDNDGDLDILLTGSTIDFEYVTKIYKNEGNEIFTDQAITTFDGITGGSGEWGDYDNDGDLDILLTGTNNNNEGITKIYRNDGNNTFTNQILSTLDGVKNGAAVWGDYDADGDLDILLAGISLNGRITKIYRNEGNDTFIERSSIILTSVYQCSLTWSDIDNDNDLDILLTGFDTSNTEVSKIYENRSVNPNTYPNSCNNLISFPNLDEVLIAWNKSTDNETPQNGLTYNIVIGSTPGRYDIVSPMADRNTGFRRIVDIGNTNHNNSWRIKGLENGTYYWSVQAIDNNFAGSVFAEEQSFRIVNPPIEPIAITDSVNGITSTTAELYGSTNPNGASSSVTFEYKKAGGEILAVFADQSPLIGTADFTVSKQITGLEVGETYQFRVTAENSAGSTSGDYLHFSTLAQAEIELSTTLLLFGDVIKNTIDRKFFTITNIGSADLEISSIEGKNSAFSIDPTNFTVKPDSSKIVYITFTPNDTINYTDTLIIKHNSIGGSNTLFLSGTGIPESLATIDLSQISVDFGTIKTTYSAQQILTISNNGTENLIINDINVDNSSFEVNQTNLIVPPNDNREVMITFMPLTDSFYEGDLTINHNAAVGTTTVSLAGRGFVYPTQIQIAADVSFANNTSQSSYKIIGLPGSKSIPIKEGIAGSHRLDWNVYWDNGNDGDQSNYLIEFNESNLFHFVPGRAFWIISKESLNINESVNAVELEPDNTFSIDLHTGWNLISNPFNKNIFWEDIRKINGGDIQPIWAYSGGFDSSIVLAEKQGYYFNNSNELNSLKIPYISNSKKGNLIRNKNLSQKFVNGLMKITLISEERKISDLIIGIEENSSIGFDNEDVISPPGDFESISFNLINNYLNIREKYLKADIRPEIGDGQEYTLSLINKNEIEFSLNFEVLKSFEDYEVYLVDKRLNNSFDLKELREIEIPGLHEKNEYSLFIGKKSFINNKISDLIPHEFLLYQNYPNPFNPNTLIRFSLPKQSSVNISVHNILGEKVQYLVKNKIYNSGSFEVNFNAENLSSGIYLYQIKTENFVDVKKMLLIK